MSEDEAKVLLKTELKFSDNDIDKLEVFRNLLLEYNSKYNLISRKTENIIWSRHILDSAQLIKYYKNNFRSNLVDLGTGGGFPGYILAIHNKNPEFHVKLYEKSPVKRQFLRSLVEADVIVCRAFKKIEHIFSISRENLRKKHKIIILKGKNAQQEINNVSLGSNYRYKLENSITDNDSKIIVVEAL